MTLKPLLFALLAIVAVVLLASWAPMATLNAVVPQHSTLTAGVAYGDRPRQQLDIYRPLQAAPAGGFPMVVFFYGGSWNSGERGDYRFIGEALASRGVLTLIADYRLYPQVRYPDFLHDSAAAVAWGQREAGRLGADPARVFVMGHSAGAYNAAMLALDSRWLDAQGSDRRQLAGWIGLAGPYDFLPIGNPDVKPVFHHPDYPPGSQPIAFAAAGSPPAFIGAAENDPLVVPLRNSAQMAQRLRAAGVPIVHEVYPHASHLTLAGAFAWPLRWLAPVLDDVAVFVTTTGPRSSALSKATPAAAELAQTSPRLATKGAR